MENGYERFTIESVAERASTARSVLYRRWPSRVDLLKAVIAARGAADQIPVPDTGSLRGDLLAMLTEFSNRRVGFVALIIARLGVYFDESGTSPAAVRGWFVPAGPGLMETIVERAIARGELAMMPPPRVLTLPADLLRHELLMTMAAVPPETIVAIVDDVFLPLATNFGRSPARD